MTDKFLQKILDATEEMRNQGDDRHCDRELSDKAKKIRDNIDGMTIYSSSIIKQIESDLGDDFWYKEPEKPRTYKPVKLALVLGEAGRPTLVTYTYDHKSNYYLLFQDGSNGRHPVKSTIQPATVKQIHEWYERFLK